MSMLLAVDTSTQVVGIVLFDGNRILCEESWISRQYHTVELASAVDLILSRAGLTAEDLQVLGVAIGPGSFTGLRIGLALVKGIAFSHQLPLIGIPTLDITVQAIPVRDQRLAAILQAGRSRLAVGWYREIEGKWISEGEVENLDQGEFIQKIDQPCILTGEISKEMRDSLQDHKFIEVAPPTLAVRSPKYLAYLTWQRWIAGDIDDVLTISPFYLHKGEPIPG
jgi:tRNA threonylcarbamoyladenosine biosynthesis protein TsaB